MRSIAAMLAAPALALVALGGCGRLGYDAQLDGADDTDAADADTTDAGPCPATYTFYGASCYRTVTTPATWAAAEADCEDDAAGAHLITLVDVDEHFDLHDLGTAAGVTETWLGYTDRITEGSFLWVSTGGLDPSLDQCYWGAAGVGAVNSPANDCAVQESSASCGDWFVRDCATALPYVCEADGHAADHAAF